MKPSSPNRSDSVVVVVVVVVIAVVVVVVIVVDAVAPACATVDPSVVPAGSALLLEQLPAPLMLLQLSASPPLGLSAKLLAAFSPWRFLPARLQ